jgi:Kef-type K+ transport system membrane component KefB
MKTAILAALAVLAAAPAAADDDDAAVVLAHCRASPSTARLCDCLLRQFDKLGEDQQALVAALIGEDMAAIAALRLELTADEAALAEGFLARETLLCRPSG